MRKTVDITIQGQIFHLEEQAYDHLQRYLDSVRTHFATYADKEEIVSDIENRIAEKFAESLTAAKQVISEEEVKTLIQMMGTPSQIDAGTEEHTAGEEPKTSAGTDSSPKRLFRNPDDQVIAGVCSGIAAYLGVDTAIVRVGFALFGLLWGWGVLLYILLWVAMPEARTLPQKVEMQGEPVTLSSIEDAVRTRLETKGDAGKTVSKILLYPFHLLGVLLHKLGNVARALWRVAGKIIRPILTVIFFVAGFAILLAGIAAVGVLTYTLLLLLLNIDAPYLEFPFRNFTSGLPYTLTLSTGYLVLALPFILLCLIGMSLVRRKWTITLSLGITLVALWMTSLMGAGILVTQYAPQLEAAAQKEWSSIQQDRTVTASNFSSLNISSGIRATVNKGDAFSVKARGRVEDLDTLTMSVDKGTLVATREWKDVFCLFCAGPQTIELTITMPALSGTALHGGSSADVQGFTSETFTVDIRNGSHATVEGAFQTVDAKVSGGSNLEIQTGDVTGKKLAMEIANGSRVTIQGTWQETDVSASGGSHVEWEGGDPASTTSTRVLLANASHANLDTRTGTLTVDVSGGSHLEVSGKGDVLNATAANGSHVDASNFSVKNATVSASGGSSVETDVTETLKADARNASHIEYMGDPETDIQEAGGSSIERRE